MFKRVIHSAFALMVLFTSGAALADTFRVRVLKNGAPVVGVSFVGNQGINNSGPHITDANGYLELSASATQIANGLWLVPWKNSGEALSFRPAVFTVSNLSCRNGVCPNIEAKSDARTQILHVSTVSTNGRPVAGIPIATMWSLDDRTYITDSDGYAAIPVAARTTCSDTDSDPLNNFVRYIPASPANHTYTFADSRNNRQCPTRNAFATITVTGGQHQAIAIGSSVTYNLQFTTPDNQPIPGVIAYGPNLTNLAESARTSNTFGLLRLNTAEIGVDKNSTIQAFFGHPSHRVAHQGMKFNPNSCRNNECTILGVRTSDSSSKSVVMSWRVFKDYGPDGLPGVRIQDVASQASATTDSSGFAYFAGRADPTCSAPQVVSPSFDGCTFSNNSSFSLCGQEQINSATISSNCNGQIPGELEVEGRVFNNLGQPYPNRPVFANGQFAAITNSLGAYSFLANRLADLKVSVNPEPGTFYDPVYVGFTKLSSAIGGLVFNQVLPLPGEDPGIGDGCEVSDRYIISGRVFGYDGEPVAGVTIHNGEEDNIVALTGPNGEYSFSVTALSDVSARAEFGEQHFAPAAHVLPRRICNAGNLDFHFTQLESLRIGGRVTYGGGFPASGITVALVSEDGSKQTYQTTTTQFDGTYDLFALEGAPVKLIISNEIEGATISPEFYYFYADGADSFDDNDFVITLPPTPTPSPTPAPTVPPAPVPTEPPSQPVPTPTTPPSSATPAPSATSAPATPAPSMSATPTRSATPIATVTSAPTPTIAPAPEPTPPPTAPPNVTPAPTPTTTLTPPTPSPAPTALPTVSPASPITVISGCENKGAGTLSWVATNPNSGAVILEYRIKDSNPEIRSILVLNPGQTTFNTTASASVPFTYRMEYRVPGNSGGWSDAYHTRTICSATPSPTPAPSGTPVLSPDPAPSSAPTVTPSVTPAPAPSSEPTQTPTPEPSPIPVDLALSAGCTDYPGYLKWIVTNFTVEGRLVLLRVYGQDLASPMWAAPGDTSFYTQVINGSANTMVAYTDSGVQFGVAAPNFNRCGSEVTPSPTASMTPSPTASAAPTAIPTAEPTPAITPTLTPPTNPTTEPTSPPARDPQPFPSAVPTARPTSEPTVAPTTIPTAMPTVTPVNPEQNITRAMSCSAVPGLADIQISNGNSYGLTLRYLGLESGVSGGFWLQGGTQNSFTLALSQGEATTVAFYINDNPVASFYLQLVNSTCSGAEPTPTPTASPTPKPDEPVYVATGSILNQQGRRVTGRVRARLENLISQGKLKVVVRDLSGDEVATAVPFFDENKLVWTVSLKSGIHMIGLDGIRVVSKPRVFSRVVVNEKTVKRVDIPGSRPFGEDPDTNFGLTGFNFAVK